MLQPGLRGLEDGDGFTEVLEPVLASDHDVPLRLRLPRDKLGATLPYQVLVEGDAGCVLDGQVRQPPERRSLLAVVASLVVVAAATLLRTGDSSRSKRW